MRNLFLVLTATLLISASSACDSGRGASDVKNPVDAAPIIDSAPYICWYFPEKAIRQVSGLEVPLKERRDGVWPSHGGCYLHSGYLRVAIDWQDFDGKRIMEIAVRNFQEKKLVDLPNDVGDGFVAYTGGPPSTHPYYGIIWFKCGKKFPWMNVQMSEVAEGRNTANDMTQLLRIARERYGKLHKCKPEPRVQP